ncbi:sll0787 family AIR synthase-like protein [Methylobacter sp. S3L5C]|uniref:sll0787 family AIR synthase-like protein n=1 Tax=Methylobacter sp. S3L5C TaxID=2839024 RepID=UPI001FABDD0C|nr:sll0787 family AIR synthase-like protein [Methylobacter sp. S3L5C]UOA07120.1 sll0787 family AIR synthase-like protein [Methylobacter sp. S3L5C]
MNELAQLTQTISQSLGLAHKRDIAAVITILSRQMPYREAGDIIFGDDCAAIPDQNGFLLLAAEGFMNEFVDTQPWFAGYCGVMVNVSDIYAMGGRPIAVVDALWSNGEEKARPVLEGLVAASDIYKVPIVGGHSNTRNDHSQLSVAILGRANRLLSSFSAKAGQKLLAAVDLRGQFREPYAWWDASTQAPAERLREDLEILPQIAEDGLCDAAKDISMAGMIGTVLMLLECSALGGVIDVTAIPCPPEIPLERWLCCFPSYGFVLSVEAENTFAVIEHFSRRDIACAVIGETDVSGRLRLADGNSEELLWDLHASPLTGCGKKLNSAA